MGSVSREMETLRKKSKGKARNRSTVMEMKDVLSGWTQRRGKQSVNFKVHQKTPPKPRRKEKKQWGKTHN